jgi:NAD(P)H-dependent flavin oxidoreductase YrpB (nitropropane dioxygenase family)
MSQQVFQSQFPILEACMNKGSTIELAIAVHQAGGYPSLCSWTYNGKAKLMQRDLDQFVETTGSNRIHLSFELNEYKHSEVLSIVKSHGIPTIEIIYGDKNTFADRPAGTEDELTSDLVELLKPIKNIGTKVFKRLYENVNQKIMDKHLIDGFCIKGAESAGFSSYTPIKEVFLRQRELTPTALLIPYGGVGTAEQVKEYIDLGAEIVAVGTVLALSAESSLSVETKLAAIKKQSKDLTQFLHTVGNVERKQNALQFEPYQGPDDANGTIGLIRGMRGKSDGHVYLGQGIDYVTEIQSCEQIIQRLASKILNV